MNVEHSIDRNVQEIRRVENRDRLKMGWSDHLADLMTAFSGSMLFVWIHLVWFASWVALNLGWFGTGTFDEFPYGLLTMIVSLEAIFLSTFVLISENRQAQQADRRAKVDLQVNMLAEQEITKLIEMVATIREHLGIQVDDDPVVKQMEQPTYVEKLADAVERAEDERRDPPGA